MDLLEEYRSISGQMVNKDKSSILLGRGAQRRQQQLQDVTGMQVFSVHFTYLGIPMFMGRSMVRACSLLMNLLLLKWKGGRGLSCLLLVRCG